MRMARKVGDDGSGTSLSNVSSVSVALVRVALTV